MSGNKGTTLTELMVTVAIIGILGAGLASAFTFGANQFAILQQETDAQTSVQQAAYYLRLFMGNALKVQCNGSPTVPTAISNPVTLVNTTLFPPNGTTGVPDGLIDCRPGPPPAPAVVWPSTQASALGIFYRENYPYTLTSPTTATSTYQAVAVYYQAPDGTDNNMGNLIFSTQGVGATTVSSTSNSIVIDHLSNIQVIGFTTTPVLNAAQTTTYNMLQTITYQITARYVRTPGIRDYSPAYLTTQSLPGYGLVSDVIQQVQIAFHDNYLGTDLTNSTTTSQRLNGGIYYYKFVAPTFSN